MIKETVSDWNCHAPTPPKKRLNLPVQMQAGADGDESVQHSVADRDIIHHLTNLEAIRD